MVRCVDSRAVMFLGRYTMLPWPYSYLENSKRHFNHCQYCHNHHPDKQLFACHFGSSCIIQAVNSHVGDVDDISSPTDKEEAVNIHTLMSTRPRFCQHCDVFVLCSGIAKYKREFPILLEQDPVSLLFFFF